MAARSTVARRKSSSGSVSTHSLLRAGGCQTGEWSWRGAGSQHGGSRKAASHVGQFHRRLALPLSNCGCLRGQVRSEAFEYLACAWRRTVGCMQS